MKNLKISYIFRSKKRNEYSIENVFSVIKEKVSDKFETENKYLPEVGYSNPIDIYKNVKFIKSIKSDIYHITGEINFLACVTPKNKTIITIHDYVNLERCKGIKRIVSFIFWNYIPVVRSKYVTCISDKVMEETIQKFPKYKNKIKLIPNPVDERLKYNLKEFNKMNPRILIIGTRENKNINRILKAVKGINCILDIIGELSDSYKNMLKEYDITYENEWNISNERMIEKYNCCDIVCFPSTYEGFGMPIIEGQSIGRAVLTSNIKPMCDIAANGACIVNPYDYLDIRNGIYKIINDDNFRNEIIRNGIKNSYKYNANIIANFYCDIYEELEKNKGEN